MAASSETPITDLKAPQLYALATKVIGYQPGVDGFPRSRKDCSRGFLLAILDATTAERIDTTDDSLRCTKAKVKALLQEAQARALVASWAAADRKQAALPNGTVALAKELLACKEQRSLKRRGVPIEDDSDSDTEEPVAKARRRVLQVDESSESESDDDIVTSDAQDLSDFGIDGDDGDDVSPAQAIPIDDGAPTVVDLTDDSDDEDNAPITFTRSSPATPSPSESAAMVLALSASKADLEKTQLATAEDDANLAAGLALSTASPTTMAAAAAVQRSQKRPSAKRHAKQPLIKTPIGRAPEAAIDTKKHCNNILAALRMQETLDREINERIDRQQELREEIESMCKQALQSISGL